MNDKEVVEGQEFRVLKDQIKKVFFGNKKSYYVYTLNKGISPDSELFETLSACIENCIQWYDGEFAQGKHVFVQVWRCSFIDFKQFFLESKTVIDSIKEAEVLGRFVEHVTDEDCEELDSQVEKIIERWMKKKNVKTKFVLGEENMLMGYGTLVAVQEYVRELEKEEEGKHYEK